MTRLVTNFTPPGSSNGLTLKRRVTINDMSTLNLDVMPGFRFSWWYTSTTGVEVLPEPIYKDEEMNIYFKRYILTSYRPNLYFLYFNQIYKFGTK